MELILIVNPRAGDRAGHERARAAVDQMVQAGHRAHIEVSRSNEHACELAVAAASQGVDRIVAVGGDGHIQAVAQALVASPTVLGILPSGTGNDIARGLGISAGPNRFERDAQRLARHVAAILGPVDAIDVIGCTDASRTRYVLSVATLGFSADVNARADRMRFPRGSARYSVATVLELPRLSSRELHLSVSRDRADHADASPTGGRRGVRTTFVAVANSSMFGGGLAIAPDARPDDGLLDLVVIDAAPRRDVLRMLPAARRGAHVRDPRVHMERCSGVDIDSDDEFRHIEVRGDGEVLGQLPMRFDAVPSALRVAMAPNVAD